jgi:alpha-glucuronidase
VQAWWRDKAREVYARIPDFGGFVVKANSEGQPGPHDYGRSHAQGANLLARAVAPFGGQVLWRAFVYDHETPDDRTKQAFDEFKPLDGSFDDNVSLQIKNGPLDFQPREPFHPLFGALERTPTLLELELTQEYLGEGTHLVYLAPLFREVLLSDTFARGAGSTVVSAVDGSLHGIERTGIAAVSNIGDARNWCGHPFAQANWYAFGRLAWNPSLDPRDLAHEWLAQTFTSRPPFVEPVGEMMLASHAVCVNTMTPLGLHHVMAKSHHFGPGPWVDQGRPDWTAVYYHQASVDGIGFDRGRNGSNAVAQYSAPVQDRLSSPATCPRELLLWFHRLAWDYPLPEGRPLWDELCLCYQRGVEGAENLLARWGTLQAWVDAERYEHVRALLIIQLAEAKWWRDASIAYFRTFARRPLPEGVPEPEHPLAHYQAIDSFPVPGAPWLV